LLSVAYKNVVGSRRASWRTIQNEASAPDVRRIQCPLKSACCDGSVSVQPTGTELSFRGRPYFHIFVWRTALEGFSTCVREGSVTEENCAEISTCLSPAVLLEFPGSCPVSPDSIRDFDRHIFVCCREISAVAVKSKFTLFAVGAYCTMCKFRVC